MGIKAPDKPEATRNEADSLSGKTRGTRAQAEGRQTPQPLARATESRLQTPETPNGSGMGADRAKTSAAPMPRAQKLATGVGLGFFIATLPLYSHTFTPFQRLEGLASYLASLNQTFDVTLVLALAVVVCAAFGRHLPKRALELVSAPTYVVGGALISFGAAVGIPQNDFLVTLVALVAGVGSVGVAVMWGRTFKGLRQWDVLQVVALATFAQVVVGILSSVLPPLVCAAVFTCSACGGAFLPLAAGLQDPAPTPVSGAEAGEDVPPTSHIRRVADAAKAFLGVTGLPLLGLAVFSFSTATMGGNVVDVYPYYLVALGACAVTLAGISSIQATHSWFEIAYRGVTPVFAVLFLTTGCIAKVIPPSIVTTAMLTLFSFAALLTLVGFALVAHTAEFSSDLTVCVGIAVFCAASMGGFEFRGAFGAEGSSTAQPILAAFYACAVLLVSHVSLSRASDERAMDERATLKSGPDEGERRTVGESRQRLERQCAELADRYGLTAREHEVLLCLARGHGGRYISECLSISPSTARGHVHNIYGKLGVASREELIELFG